MQHATHRNSLRLLCLAAATTLVLGCASHRAPPTCKGPYTPINQPFTAAAHDAQR